MATKLTKQQWIDRLEEAKRDAPGWTQTEAERHDWAVGPTTRQHGQCPEEGDQ